ncbi:MAG TPA: F0F1 ATP synthase subunit A [Polyangiaceae bacterium]|jgi:F-type H+-transporting ATPase subunit a|nr:F0F1 ATP synthase subunit A [Polyangiaceae bacterium]
MPEHTSFFTYLLAMFPALGRNMSMFGESFLGHQPVDAHAAEPLAASVAVMLLVLLLAVLVQPAIANQDSAVIPETRLTLRTIFEVWIGYWYGMMKDMMGPKRAKQYFPLIGALSVFIVLSNALGLIPGFTPPTSNWNITLGCAALVFIMFNYYGFKEGGLGYVKHLFGPWLGWPYVPVNLLLFVVETFSLFIRPLTLSIRLMLNMAVDHLLVTIMLGMVALFLPIPVLILGTLICIVQVLVFCLLTSIYITLATEHDENEADAKSHGAGAAHAAGAGF